MISLISSWWVAPAALSFVLLSLTWEGKRVHWLDTFTALFLSALLLVGIWALAWVMHLS